MTVSMQGGQSTMIAGVNYNLTEDSKADATAAKKEISEASSVNVYDKGALDSIDVVRNNIDALVSGWSDLKAQEDDGTVIDANVNASTGDTVEVNGTSYELVKNQEYLDDNGDTQYHDVFVDNSGNEYATLERNRRLRRRKCNMIKNSTPDVKYESTFNIRSFFCDKNQREKSLTI